MLVNEDRYGYASCPCRLADGLKAKDLDIVCPCDYRDSDLSQFGSCFCGLYVSENIYKGVARLAPVPDRRLPEKAAAEVAKQAGVAPVFQPGYPVWRCKVCGYLCAREDSPGACPICKAAKERFERFI